MEALVCLTCINYNNTSYNFHTSGITVNSLLQIVNTKCKLGYVHDIAKYCFNKNAFNTLTIQTSQKQ